MTDRFSILAALRGEYAERPGVASCETHGEYAVREFIDGEDVLGVIPGQCPKCVEAQRQVEAQQKAETEFLRMLADAKVPKRFLACELEGYRASAGTQQALEMISDYVDRWPEQVRTGESLLLIGDVGTGKTHLAVSVVKHVLRTGKRARYCTVAELLREIRATWKGVGERTESQMLDYFSSVPLLVLDEVGASYGSDNEKVILFDVLNERYERMLPTIVCGNVTKEELIKALDERVIDRLRENGGKLAVLTGKSWRKVA